MRYVHQPAATVTDPSSRAASVRARTGRPADLVCRVRRARRRAGGCLAMRARGLACREPPRHRDLLHPERSRDDHRRRHRRVLRGRRRGRHRAAPRLVRPLGRHRDRPQGIRDRGSHSRRVISRGTHCVVQGPEYLRPDVSIATSTVRPSGSAILPWVASMSTMSKPLSIAVIGSVMPRRPSRGKSKGHAQICAASVGRPRAFNVWHRSRSTWTPTPTVSMARRRRRRCRPIRRRRPARARTLPRRSQRKARQPVGNQPYVIHHRPPLAATDKETLSTDDRDPHQERFGYGAAPGPRSGPSGRRQELEVCEPPDGGLQHPHFGPTPL